MTGECRTLVLACTGAVLFTLTTFGIDRAQAHDNEHHRIRGDRLRMSWDGTNAARSKLKFTSKRQLAINVIPLDPRVADSVLTVRGTGLGDGNTGAIKLYPLLWKAAGKSGYRYKADPKTSASRGIRTIRIKTGSRGGSLKVIAKGQYWPFAITQAQQTVELYLTIGDDTYCAEFSNFDANEPGAIAGRDSDPPADCDPVCGNGVLELGEECDDANAIETDTCNTSCIGCDPQDVEYTSTFDAIQALIFDSPLYECSNDLCHGAALAGGLDLRGGASHAALYDVAAQIDPGQVRIFPGQPDLSLLYNKIAEKTLGDPDAPGAAMPNNAETVSQGLLEAIELWIAGGASDTAVVAGTAELFDACLPPANPLNVPRPDPPATGTGVQFPMPGWLLPKTSEKEICVATYYDVDDPLLVPAGLRVPCTGGFPSSNTSDECFAFNSTFAVQDPHSHHLAVHIYKGAYDWTDPGWGVWHCYGGDDSGQACNPTTPGVCPGDGVCAGTAVPGAGCFTAGPGFGPPDYGFGQGPNSPRFAGGNNATTFGKDPDGVYTLLPLSGIVVFNSHAFNLTGQDTDMNAWLNVEFTNDLQWPAVELTDTSKIFVVNVAPYQQQEYCWTHTFAEGSRVYQLSSHTHKRGKRFRYYKEPQTPCTSVSTCSPGLVADLIYETFDYADPQVLEFDPPRVYSGSVADRTIKYCALYDNGAGDPTEVKLQSTSPCPALGCGTLGGPCLDSAVKCTVGGPNTGQLCGGDDFNCPGATCDACNAWGGVTTEDEMFIATGRYYLP